MIVILKKYILLGVLISGLALVLYAMPERPLNENMRADLQSSLQLSGMNR